MKNKRMGLIITIVLTIFVASVMLGSVAADDSTEVTIGKEKFKIPNGFTETDSKELKGGTIVKKFENGDKFIKLNVNSGEDKISSVKMQDGEVQKDIANKTGAWNNETHMFTYVSQDQKTTVMVQCDSMETLEAFLKLN